MGSTKSKVSFEICAVTGDFHAEDIGPVVHLVMFDEDGNQSPTLTLDNLLQTENNIIQAKFTIDKQKWSSLKIFHKLEHIEFWKINAGLPLAWYLEKIIIRDRRKGLGGKWEYFFFPVHKWIEAEQHYVVHNCHTFLPSAELYPEIREAELAERQETFVYFQRAKGLPVELKEAPEEEIFSRDSALDIERDLLDITNRVGLSVEYNSADSWPSFDALGNIFKMYNITAPMGLEMWSINDTCFGAQRLKGCNPFVLKLCKEIPENFGVVMEWLKPHLEGWTVKHILDAKRLYVVDYQIMDGLEVKNGREFCAPIALFFVTEKRELKPLAIQLNQEIEEGNPVFIPSDSQHVWLQAKLWFNMVDAAYHLIVVRLLSHLILEGIYAAMRRNLAQSHPIYQLMAPHFRSFVAVTRKLKEWVFNPDGWIAKNMQLTKKGIRQLLKRAFKQWRFDVHANIHRELELRGVYDTNALPVYPYRDDALLVHKSLDHYVGKMVRYFYPKGRDSLIHDPELQNWRREMAARMDEGGLGLKGVPGGDPPENYRPKYGTAKSQIKNGDVPDGIADYLTTTDDTIKFLACILHLDVIVAGSASRLPMYDEYGFPPNYPLSLYGPLPTDPLSDSTAEGNEEAANMEDVLRALPNRHSTLDTLLSVRLASKVPQSVLGQFDSEHIYDPGALHIVNEFRANLAANSQRIQERNNQRDMFHRYWCLDPANIPNYPGI